MEVLPRYCIRCATALEKRVPKDDNRERHVCPACGHIHYIQPKVAAGSVPFREGRIALIRRGVDPRAGFWSFPCGFMECDEDARATAVRETEEETGLVVALTGEVGTYTYADSLHGVSVVVIVYAARVTAGELHPGDDAVEARWVDPDDIPWDDLAFRSTHEGLRDWLRRTDR